jgi:hypothetical protein
MSGGRGQEHEVITWMSILVFAAALAGMWWWAGRQRRYGHVKKRQR